jgi:OOP family OmpA-OmpF porin
MKAKQFLKLFGVLILGVLLTNCAQKFSRTQTDYSCIGEDLNEKVKNNELVKKVDNLLVVLDASSTMADKSKKGWHNKQRKFPVAKELLLCMNETIPDIELNAGLRAFGPYYSEKGLIYGMTNYTKAGFNDTVYSMNSTGGITPIANSIHHSRMDLEETTGKIAVVLFSDGKNNAIGNPVTEAASMKSQFGNDVCIYTVLLGNDPKGKAVMDGIAKAGECGFATDADTLLASNSMSDFVTQVLLAKGAGPRDSDGDGVYDHLDQCPNTPRGIKVDSVGCPVPIKEKVSITLHIEFDFDKDTVRPVYHSHIMKVANFLKAYPETNAVLEGHTDIRGTEAYNLDLSKRRAESVKSYLVDKFGISSSRISTKGFGYSQPVATNKTDEGRQQNRRVVANIVTMVVK